METDERRQEVDLINDAMQGIEDLLTDQAVFLKTTPKAAAAAAAAAAVTPRWDDAAGAPSTPPRSPLGSPITSPKLAASVPPARPPGVPALPLQSLLLGKGGPPPMP